MVDVMQEELQWADELPGEGRLSWAVYPAESNEDGLS